MEVLVKSNTARSRERIPPDRFTDGIVSITAWIQFYREAAARSTD